MGRGEMERRMEGGCGEENAEEGKEEMRVGVQTHPIPAPPQNSSKSRLRHLESLHAFVSAATKELMWLNEKEEEEVNFDWSDRNPNMTAKKENYSVRSARAAAPHPPHPSCPCPALSPAAHPAVLGGPQPSRPCAWLPMVPVPPVTFLRDASCSQGQGGLSVALSLPISSQLTCCAALLCCPAL